MKLLLRISPPSYKLLFISLFAFFISACGGGSSNNASLDEFSTKNITVNVLDVDGSVFTQTVTIKLSGADFVDANQNPIDSITFPTTKTFKAKVAEDSNVDLKLLSSTNNYVDSGITLQTQPDTIDYSMTLYLVPKVSGSSKTGIYTEVGSISDVIDGVAQTDISLKLEEPDSTPSLAVTILDETILSDGEGNPVTPDSFTMVRYNPLEAGVLDAYPGGLNVIADMNDGTTQQVNFKSAGFASIVLQNVAGEKVKKFDQNITVAMQFKIGITDNTGTVAKIGDEVPIWSFDEDDGTWKFEKNGKVEDLDTSDGLYDVTFETNHLTFYNLDWNITNVCNADIEIENATGSAQTAQLTVEFAMPAFNIQRTFNYQGDGNISLLSSPAIGTQWELIFKDPDTNDVVGTYTSTDSICDEHVATVDTEVPSTEDSYQVLATSNISGCDNYSGNISLVNDVTITGNVGGFSIQGSRNPDNGQVLFGLVGGGDVTVAGFGGTINGAQASGTWNQSEGNCSGTWTGTLQ